MNKLEEACSQLKSFVDTIHGDYTKWIKKNPGRAGDIESSVKVIAYLLYGRFKRNSLIPELLYCSSNLLTFWHDTLLKAEAERLTAAKSGGGGGRPAGDHTYACSKDGKEDPVAAGTGAGGSRSSPVFKSGICTTTTGTRIQSKEAHRIKVLLTIMEYFEVFLEVSAKQLWGDPGRWIVILIIQALKFCFRSVLLFHYKVGMIESPALQPFDRRNGKTLNPRSPSPSVVFILKHSGRVVRKIQSSPPISQRSWKLPAVPNLTNVPNDLPPLRLIAEIIHILRPLSHLVGLGVWGTDSWKPWIIGLGLDISSLHLHGQPNLLKSRERIELTRRTWALLLYLIRSPFYDQFTKRKLLGSLYYLSRKVPIVGNLFGTIAESIPEWQQTYTYVWNDV